MILIFVKRMIKNLLLVLVIQFARSHRRELLW